MKLSEVDQVLIRYADTLSPTAISAKINGLLTPEQVMTRIDQLLETPDRLTALQQDQLVTLKMRQLIVELEEMKLNPRVAEIMIRALESLGNRLDKRAESTEKELSTLYAFQGTVMLEAINIAMAHMRGRLTGAGRIPEAEWDAALEDAIRYAQLEINKHEHDAAQIEA